MRRLTRQKLSSRVLRVSVHGWAAWARNRKASSDHVSCSAARRCPTIRRAAPHEGQGASGGACIRRRSSWLPCGAGPARQTPSSRARTAPSWPAEAGPGGKPVGQALGVVQRGHGGLLKQQQVGGPGSCRARSRMSRPKGRGSDCEVTTRGHPAPARGRLAGRGRRPELEDRRMPGADTSGVPWAGEPVAAVFQAHGPETSSQSRTLAPGTRPGQACLRAGAAQT